MALVTYSIYALRDGHKHTNTCTYTCAHTNIGRLKENFNKLLVYIVKELNLMFTVIYRQKRTQQTVKDIQHTYVPSVQKLLLLPYLCETQTQPHQE